MEIKYPFRSAGYHVMKQFRTALKPGTFHYVELLDPENQENLDRVAARFSSRNVVSSSSGEF